MWPWNKVLVLTPNYRSYGHCCEEIYLGLLKARRENKKVLFIYPYELFWKFRFGVLNRQLFNLESPYCLFSSTNILWHFLRLVVTAYYFLSRTFYLSWRWIQRRFIQAVWPGYQDGPFDDSHVWLKAAPYDYCLPKGVTRFSWEIADRMKWQEEFHQYLPVTLSAKAQQRAQRMRQEMGLPLNDWFVILHVRESGFYKNTSLERDLWNYRNASVQNYLKGIETITKAGGWVVRVGDSSMTPLQPMQRVIDYIHTPFKSELMDLYLIQESKFAVVSDSGVGSVAFHLFQKPGVMVNSIPWSWGYPIRRGNLAILKHVFSPKHNRFLSLREIVEGPCEFSLMNKGYRFEENTPEEIEDIIREFMERPPDAPDSELQELFRQRRRQQIRRLAMETLYEDPLFDAYQKYYMAGFMYQAAGALAHGFLERNWQRCVLNSTAEAGVA